MREEIHEKIESYNHNATPEELERIKKIKQKVINNHHFSEKFNKSPENMNKKQKNDLKRILEATALFLPLFFVEHVVPSQYHPEHWFMFAVSMVPYLIVGYDADAKAWVQLFLGFRS